MRLMYKYNIYGKKLQWVQQKKNEGKGEENGMRFKVTLSGSFDYVVKDYGWSLLRIGKFI